MRLPRIATAASLLAMPLLWPSRAYTNGSDATENSSKEPQVAIEESILIQGRARNYLRELSDQFGGRLTGSRAYEESAEWAVKKFEEMGLTKVYVEAFGIASGWERGTSTGAILAPVQRPLHLESLGWAPSTPAGGNRGSVVVLSNLDGDYLNAKAAEIKGHIVLLESTQPDFGEDWTSFFRRQQICYSLLNKFGAIGVLEPDSEYNDVLNADAATWDGSLAPLPIAQIGMEDAKLIKRLAEKAAVEIIYECQNRTRSAIEVKNVIAELPGNQRPDEWVVVGAHLDSWDFATGALDNGSGVAMVLETARAISALHRNPSRSIRFVLWGGEEEGMLGSAAWVRSHRSELEKVVAYLNTDNGSGHPRGWKVEGRKDVEEAMRPLSEGLSDLDGDALSEETTYDSDHGPFMLEGVPVLDLWVDMSNYFRVHHKSSDTFDKVENLYLNACSAIVGVTVYTLADRPKPLARRIGYPAVREILKRANLDLDFLKSLGWSF
jgi:carboxypeptidase Q